MKKEIKQEKAEENEDDEECESDPEEKDSSSGKLEEAIKALKKKNGITEFDKTMDSNTCFYIKSVEHPSLGLTSDIGDEYAKSKYELINIDVHHLVKDNIHQKWSYDEDTRKLTTHAHPNMAVFAGSNKNVVLF